MTILVTGASRGIGREIAKNLAQKGNIVIANYNKSEEQAQNLQKENANIEIYKADVSKREEVKQMVEYVLKKYGKIDVLVNNAGISENKLFTDVTDEDWQKIINTNLYSAFCVTQEVLPNMIHNKFGCIINISSIWGMVGASCETVYSIAKAGIDAMTKSLAKELGPSNIRVNSIAPGIIDTDMNKNLTQEDIENIKNEIPLQKVGKTIDIAKCVEWLINDQYTTGQIISINGGWVII
ncbi:MAG: 3-oxoacyl-ACP reductase FabG [Clostridia bacterium]|nr:3-oxoacyl-ACP reductase FabG [Clostridia bacterium]